MSYEYQTDKQCEVEQQQLDLLVEVSGKDLRVNGIVLDKLSKIFNNDKIPVVVFSVLGQHKLKKTSLLNYALRGICEKENLSIYRFPLNSNDEHPKFKCWQGVAGILSTSLRSFNMNNGSTSIWFLLDIWMEDPVEELYNKLVDFCLNVSSKIIFLPQTIDWTSEILALLQRSSVTASRRSLQVNVLIENDLPETYSSDVLSSNNCNIKTLLEAVSEINPFHGPITLKTVSEIVNNFPTHSANVSETCGWINECVDAVNKKTLMPVYNSEQLNLNDLTISQEDNADIDMIDVQQRLQDVSVQDSNRLICLLQNCKEYYVNRFKRRMDNQQWLAFEDDDLRQQNQSLMQEMLARLSIENLAFIPQLKQHAEAWFCEVEKLNETNKHQLNVLEKRVDENVRAIEDQLYNNICRNEEIVSLPIIEDCVGEIYRKLSADITQKPWLELLERIIIDEVQVLGESLWHVDNAIQLYRNSFVERFRKMLCINKVEFEDLHKESLEIAIQNVDKLTRRNASKFFNKLIENQRKILNDSNSRIYREEQRIAADAYNYAVESYHLLLDKQIFSNTLSINASQMVHKRLSSEIVDLFLKGLKHPHTEPWKCAQGNLKSKLMSSELERKCVEKNKNHLANVELVRKESIESGKQYYRDEMTNVLQTTKLSAGKFHELSDKCYHEADRKFHENVDRKVAKNISQLWKDDLRIAIGEIKLALLKKNDNKPLNQSIHSTKIQSKAMSGSNVEQQSQMHRYGIALYIDAHGVRVGVFVDQQIQCERNLVVYDHTITVDSTGEVLIGAEASLHITERTRRKTSDEPKISNVFKFLCGNVTVNWPALIAGRSVVLKKDELLSLYFQKIRMDTELLVNQSVTSCYVAVSGLLSCGAKQMLKTSLTFAGYQSNILIPCTTTMAISHCLKFREGDLAFQGVQSNVFVYICGNLVEFAVVNTCKKDVNVKNVGGHIDIFSATGTVDKVKNYLHRSAVVGNVEKIFEDMFCGTTSQQINRIIFCDATQNGQNEILHSILEAVRKRFPSCVPTHFSVTDDIIRVTSMLDASKNGSSNVPSMPSYNYIHPYKISTKLDRQSYHLWDFNDTGNTKHSFRINRDMKMEIYEEAKSWKSRWAIDSYKLTLSPKHVSKMEVIMGKEGNLIVEMEPERGSVKPTFGWSRSLTSSGRQEIFDALRPFIEQRERNFKRQFPSINPANSCQSQSNKTDPAPPTTPSCNHKYQPNTQPNTTKRQQQSATDSSLEELKSNLVQLIETIQRELKGNQSTATAIRDNIELKINKCKTLMNQTDVTVKKLQFEKNNLEQVSKHIKK